MDIVAGAWTVSHGERAGSRVSEDGSNSAALSSISVGPTERAESGYASCRLWNPRELSFSILSRELLRQWLDTRAVLIRVVREAPSRHAGILTTAHQRESRPVKRGRQNSTGVEQPDIAVAQCSRAVP